jgi:LysR family transcriptional activator of mexEF-oprN operon
MNEIDLRRFDLNLLIVFEVLMIERNVTRAAERLGRTQSAVSHSLSRLRKQLSDPLLIKAGVRMQPTAFALDLLEQARPLLRGMQRVLSPRQIFDPANSRRLFRVAAADFMQTMFSSLLARLRSEAPGVCVEWVSPRDSLLLDLAEGQIDIAITQAPSRMPEGITGEAVGTLQWRCFAREGHPAFSEWGVKAWTRWPHLAIRASDVLTSPVQLAASAAGLERTVAGWVPHFSIAPILASSDLLATMPAITEGGLGYPYRLESREVPFPIAALPQVMLWNVSRKGDPEIVWLCDRLGPIIKIAGERI